MLYIFFFLEIMIESYIQAHWDIERGMRVERPKLFRWGVADSLFPELASGVITLGLAFASLCCSRNILSAPCLMRSFSIS